MKPLFTIFRKITAQGAFGMMWHNGEASAPFAVTVERTYEVDGQPSTTKVKAGVHLCKKRPYYKGGYDTYEIVTPGHTAILFHKGNKELDSDGCCLIAESFVDADARAGAQAQIADSKHGFEEFMLLTGGVDEFYTEYVDV